jgi:hypothetical protein
MSAKSCTPRTWPRALRMVGDPVDVVTGAQAFFETDFRLRGEHIPISWTRHYDSRRHQMVRGIGHGFRLSFDVELRFDLDGMCFVNGEGETIEFPFLTTDGERLLRGGHELERLGSQHYRVHPPGGKPSWECRFDREPVARPSSLFLENDPRPPVRLQYDKGCWPHRDEFPPAAIKPDDPSRVSVKPINPSQNRRSGSRLRGELPPDGTRVRIVPPGKKP